MLFCLLYILFCLFYLYILLYYSFLLHYSYIKVSSYNYVFLPFFSITFLINSSIFLPFFILYTKTIKCFLFSPPFILDIITSSLSCIELFPSSLYFFTFFYSKTSFFLIPHNVTTHSYMSTWYSIFYFILCVLHVSLKFIKSCLTTNLQKSLSYLADLIFQNKQLQIFFSVTTECLFSLFGLIKILLLLFFQSFFFSS